MIHFTDLIVEPYILLIIEYLDNVGRCICNNFQDDKLSVCIVNKEMYRFIHKYKPMSPIHGFYTVPSFCTAYFNRPTFCMYHHLDEREGSFFHTICSGIRTLQQKQNRTAINSNMLSWEVDYIDMRKNDEIEYIHGKDYTEAQDMKSFILKHTKGIKIMQNTCCTGRGFAISFDAHSNTVLDRLTTYHNNMYMQPLNYTQP